MKAIIKHGLAATFWALILSITSPPTSHAVETWAQLGMDIDGEATVNFSGKSCSLSSSGNRVAIGAHGNADNGSNSGHVRIFEIISGVWTQLGNDIDGEAASDFSGWSSSLSSNGNRVAIGALNNGGKGHARIFELVSGVWTQLGSDIDGEAAGDSFGRSLSLSADGSRVAIGALGNDGTGGAAGHVRVFELSTGTWNQVGIDLDGEAAGDQSGTAVALSGDGNWVAIGAPFNDGFGGDSGHVRVYEWVVNAWVQRGADINGLNPVDKSGNAVALSADGSWLAIGANLSQGASGFNSKAGSVRVFEWSGTTWIQRGAVLNGSAAGEEFGTSVSLSSDGSRVIIGAPKKTASTGQVKVYEYDTGSWTQLGNDINGEATGNLSGTSVAMFGSMILPAVPGPKLEVTSMDQIHLITRDAPSRCLQMAK